MTMDKATAIVEDRLLTNAIAMVQKLKAKGQMEKAAQIEKGLRARRNAMLLQMYAA